MLEISWKDQVTKKAVLKKMKEESLHFTNNIVKQKLAYGGRVLRGFSG